MTKPKKSKEWVVIATSTEPAIIMRFNKEAAAKEAASFLRKKEYDVLVIED
jgi:hypothetical protein